VGTTKLTPLDSDDMEDLMREVTELEKRETQRIAARKQAIKKAYDATDEDACADSADPKGCAKAHEQIKWRTSQDKYERAAYTDIVNEDHTKDGNTDADDAAMKQTQQEILHYKKLSDKLSGNKELKQLNEDAENLEKARAVREEKAIKLLRAEKHKLAQVKVEEMQERDDEDRKKQARKTAEVQRDIESHGTMEMYNAPPGKARSSMAQQTTDNAVEAGIQEAERTQEAAPSGPSHHELAVKAAAKIEEERQSYFEKQVQALKQADLNERKERSAVQDKAEAVPAATAKHLTQYEKDEEAAMLHDSQASSAEKASRAKELEKIRVRTVAEQKEANARASANMQQNDAEAGYRKLGLAPDTKLAHVMSDDYRADVTLAKSEDVQRQDALEKQIRGMRARSAAKSAQLQKQARSREEQHLAAENSKAGYSSAKPDTEYKKQLSKATQETMENNRRIANEIAHQYDIEKVRTTNLPAEGAQQAVTDKVIDARENEINQIFGP